LAVDEIRLKRKGQDHGRECAEFQLRVAHGWVEKGAGLRQHGMDCFGFVAYFAALNALYWLWNFLASKKHPKELDQLLYLVDQLEEATREEILYRVKSTIDYFLDRPPIQNMKKRKTDGLTGESERSCQLKEELKNTDPKARLRALAEILYFVRCNLVHGSKHVDGLDRELLQMSLLPLQLLAQETVKITERRWGPKT
jgi:hypothetical protein